MARKTARTNGKSAASDRGAKVGPAVPEAAVVAVVARGSAAQDGPALLRRAAAAERRLLERERNAEQRLAKRQSRLAAAEARLSRAQARVTRRLAAVAEAEATLGAVQAMRATGPDETKVKVVTVASTATTESDRLPAEASEGVAKKPASTARPRRSRATKATAGTSSGTAS